MKNCLLEHPALQRYRPEHRSLVRFASSLSEALNPFETDKVSIKPAILYDSTFNSKAPVAYEMIFEKIYKGEIERRTKVVAASSGNTGLGLAQMFKALDIHCEIVMQNDTPPSKVGVISALGNPISTTLISASTVQYAREKGAQSGWCNVDQYAAATNAEAQYKYLAPHLLSPENGRIDIVVVPGGTLGTATGVQRLIRKREFETKVVLALCADGQEVPGARDAARIGRDVTFASVDDFEYRMTATRYHSFLASYAMFAEVEWTQGGPTSGLALSVALRFVQQHKDAGSLDQFRGPDGRINVVFLCPDDYRLYGDLYRSTLNEHRDFFLSSVPVSRLLEAG